MIKYREDVQVRIEENDRKLAELKEQIKVEKKEARMASEKMLMELDQKNAKLKMGIQEYKEGTKEKWEQFKMDFNRDLDDLGKSISDMANKNMKKKN